MKKQALPAIDVPLMEPTGEVSLPWYLFFKSLNSAIFGKEGPGAGKNS